METYIQSFCGITNSRLFTDKTSDDTAIIELNNFFKEKYKEYTIDYPKFFKMDSLSKAALIALSAQNYQPSTENLFQRGIVFSNHNSSIDTDKKYAISCNTIPSPSLFVYTLPNICIGEVSIKYGCKGHSNFFISTEMDIPLLVNYTNYLFAKNKLQECITGWVDVVENTISCFIYIVSTQKTNNKHSTENIHNILKDNRWKI